MLEQIWSGWRSSYVVGAGANPATSGGASDSSVFTQLLESGLPDEETHIVHRADHVFSIVNIHPYTSGHLLVLPYREVAEIELLTEDESAELWTVTMQAAAVIRAEYRPHGMNIGLNLGRPAGGSIPTHLHMHVVPRWTGDSNFMSTIANAQTLPEALVVTASRLRVAWNAQTS
ncbi:MAG: ATP adenylyltransferase [Ilumatobacter sp.]|jgi:ATP adenylyltransferase